MVGINFAEEGEACDIDATAVHVDENVAGREVSKIGILKGDQDVQKSHA